MLHRKISEYQTAIVDELSERAFEDQCTVANPRYPLVTELADIYRAAFWGRESEK